MLKKLSISQKYLLFGLLLLLISLFIYKNNIRTTIDLYNQNQLLRSKISTGGTDIPNRFSQLQQQLHTLENKLGSGFSGADTTDVNVLDLVTGLVHRYHLSLKFFPEPVQMVQKEYNIQYYTFTVEGGFIPTTTLIHELEQHTTKGRIRSVDYKLTQQFASQKKTLRTTVYFQMIKKQAD